jgi:probable rRNA maturation factor
MNTLQVLLENPHEFQDIPTLTEFELWVNTALSIAKPILPNSCECVMLHLVDEAESAELNEAHRSKTGPTNILSFDYEMIPGFEQDSLGDLIVCVPVMEKEALAQHIPLKNHWAHLTIHGVLHLLGYDHMNDEDAAKMEPLEISALKVLHIENPYLNHDE